jgi:hypothetical protein
MLPKFTGNSMTVWPCMLFLFSSSVWTFPQGLFRLFWRSNRLSLCVHICIVVNKLVSTFFFNQFEQPWDIWTAMRCLNSHEIFEQPWVIWTAMRYLNSHEIFEQPWVIWTAMSYFVRSSWRSLFSGYNYCTTDRNTSPGLGQTRKCWVAKLINGSRTLPSK